MHKSYDLYIQEINNCLNRIEIDLLGKRQLSPREAFRWLIAQANIVRENNKQIYFVGNGASASMASHSALDMWKNNKIKSTALNDFVSLTAISNDYSYEDVFSEPIKSLSNPKDMLVCISSSGNSPNIIKSAIIAKTRKLTIVTFSAMSPKNKLRKLGHLNFYFPAKTYGLAEICHQALLHIWLDNQIL